MKADNTTDSAQLVLNGQRQAVPSFDPNTSLLAYLRDQPCDHLLAESSLNGFVGGR